MSSAAATENLWQTMSDGLRSWLRWRVRDDDTADDLLAETFLRVHDRLEDLDDPERVGAWVHRIARNALIDHYRAWWPAHDQSLPAEIVHESDAADGANLNATIGRCLRTMIEELPDVYREPLGLYELDGLSQGEVADRLGLSLPATKSRIQRGRALLRGRLFACCHVEFDARGNALEWTRRRDCSGCASG